MAGRDLNYGITYSTKVVGKKALDGLQQRIGSLNITLKSHQAEYARTAKQVKASLDKMSTAATKAGKTADATRFRKLAAGIRTATEATEMSIKEWKKYSARLATIKKVPGLDQITQQLRNQGVAARKIGMQVKATETELKEAQASNKLYASQQAKTQKEYRKQYDDINKEYMKRQTIQRDVIKQQLAANKIWTKGGTTQQYVSKMLTMTSKQHQQLSKRIIETGDAQRLANDISKRGYKTITPQLRKQLETRVKEINAIKQSGIAVSASGKKQNEAILTLNNSLQKYHTAWGKVMNKVNAGIGIIKKAGMMFLTLLGPLFLVGAALRTVQQAADWAYQPFIKFEDALYELRKTADLSMKAMLDMGEAIAKMSIITPIAADELAKIAATAARLGIRGKENILEFTRVIAMMSLVTTLSAEDAATSMAKIRQAFGIPIENIEELGSILNELENTTAATVEAIISGMENVGASAKMIGISEDAVAAMTATLIASGMEGSRSGTRLRRAFTEMARNYSKMADQMGISSEDMKAAIEQDPTKALLEYLKFLNEVESNVDKLTYSHEVFLKVGGFAIATLAENYEELEKNMGTAQEQMIWGTSLQREYSIATSKTSAQLQLLNNRMEASRREIGESLIPSLMWTKRRMIELTDALVVGSRAVHLITGEIDKSGTALDAMVEEQENLVKAVEEGLKPWQEFISLTTSGLGLLTKTYSVMGALIYDVATTHGKNINQITDDFDDWLKSSQYAYKRALQDTSNWTDALELERRKYEEVTPLIKTGVDYIKETADETSNAYKAVTLYEQILAREGGAIEYINSEIEDEIEREKAIAQVKMLSAKARLNLVDVITKEYKNAGQLSAENYKTFTQLKKYKEENIKIGEKVINFLDRENIAFEYNRVAANEGSQSWYNWNKVMLEAGEITEFTTEQNQQVFDSMMGLKKIGKDVIFTGKEYIIVSKDEADAFYDKTVTIKDQIRILDKYTDTTGNALTQDNMFRGELERLIRAEINVRDIELQMGNTRNQLYKSTWDLYGLSQQYVSTYSTMYDTWDSILDAEREASGLTKTLITTYKGELSIIDQLVKSSVALKDAGLDIAASDKITEASTRARALAEELKIKAFQASSDEERTSYKQAFRYVSDYLSLTSQSVKGVEDLELIWDQTSGTIGDVRTTLADLPILLAGAKESVEDIRDDIKYIEIPPNVLEFFDIDRWRDLYPIIEDVIQTIDTMDEKKELSVTIDKDDLLMSFQEAWKPLEDVGVTLNVKVIGDGKKLLDYIGTLEELKIEGVAATVLGEGQTGIRSVPKTGLYKLHKDEEVLTKSQAKQDKANVIHIYNSFPNMIVREMLDVGKVRDRIVEVVDTALSKKLLR